MRDTFRPEFLNRIDRIITFRPMSIEIMESLVRKELADLQNRETLVTRGITLDFSDGLVRRLAEEGFDPQWGARLLQRQIERFVVAPLAKHLLKNPGRQSIDLGKLVENR
jgi:ATP-dependent Clp protease ATP-binding subunit ClpC